jgi:hypothetical protein
MAGIGDSWGTREELLHPRDSHGRFRSKWKMGPAVLAAVLKVLESFRPRTFQSDGQARQYTQNLAHRNPGRFGGGKGYARLQTDFMNANEDLLDGNPDEPSTKKFVEMMDHSMIDLPDDVIVSSVVPPAAFGLTPDRLPELEELTGNVIANRGYLSSSIGTPLGGGNGNITMTIATPKGTKMAIPGRGPNDPEMIFDRDQELTITKVKPDGRGGYMVAAVATPKTPGENPLPETGHAGPGKPADREAAIKGMEDLGAQRDMGEQGASQLPGGQAAGGLPEENGKVVQAGPGGAPQSPEEQRAASRAAVLGRAPASGAQPAAGAPPAQATPVAPVPSAPAEPNAPVVPTQAPTPAPNVPEAVPSAVQPPNGATSVVTGNPATSFREAVRDASLESPTPGARRREWNSAYQGVVSGKVHPEDALRELESDITNNKEIQKTERGHADSSIGSDIEKQEKLADLIRSHFTLGEPKQREGRHDVARDLENKRVTEAKKNLRPGGGTQQKSEPAHADRLAPRKVAPPRKESQPERNKQMADQVSKDAEDDKLNEAQRAQWSDEVGPEPEEMKAGDTAGNILLDETADLLRNGRATRPKAVARLRDHAGDSDTPEADYLRKVADAIESDESKPNKRVPLKKVVKVAPDVEAAEKKLAGRTDKNILTGLNGLSVGDLRALSDKWGVEQRGEDKKLKLKAALAKELAAKWKATPELQRKVELPEGEEAPAIDDLDNMTVAQLKDFAKANGIKITGALRKDAMRDAIKRQRDRVEPETPAAPEPEAPAAAPVKKVAKAAVKKAVKAAPPAAVEEPKTPAAKALTQVAEAPEAPAILKKAAKKAAVKADEPKVAEAPVTALGYRATREAALSDPNKKTVSAARLQTGEKLQVQKDADGNWSSSPRKTGAKTLTVTKINKGPNGYDIQGTDEDGNEISLQRISGQNVVHRAGIAATPRPKKRTEAELVDFLAEIKPPTEEQKAEALANRTPLTEEDLHGMLKANSLRQLKAMSENIPGFSSAGKNRQQMQDAIVAHEIASRTPSAPEAPAVPEGPKIKGVDTAERARLQERAREVLAEMQAAKTADPFDTIEEQLGGGQNARDIAKMAREVKAEVEASSGPSKLSVEDRVAATMLSRVKPQYRQDLLDSMPEADRKHLLDVAERMAQENTRVKKSGHALDQILADAGMKPPPEGSAASHVYHQVRGLLVANKLKEAKAALRDDIRGSDMNLESYRRGMDTPGQTTKNQEFLSGRITEELDRSAWSRSVLGTLEGGSAASPELATKKEIQQVIKIDNPELAKISVEDMKRDAAAAGIKLPQAATTKSEVMTEIAREMIRREKAGNPVPLTPPPAAPKVKAAPKPKAKVEVRALLPEGDWNDGDTSAGSPSDKRMLDTVQKMLDGENIGGVGKDATPGAVGRYLEKWSTGSGGPGYRAAVHTLAVDSAKRRLEQATPQERPALEAEYQKALADHEEIRAQNTRWKALAEKLKATKRPRATAATKAKVAEEVPLSAPTPVKATLERAAKSVPAKATPIQVKREATAEQDVKAAQTRVRNLESKFEEGNNLEPDRHDELLGDLDSAREELDQAKENLSTVKAKAKKAAPTKLTPTVRQNLSGLKTDDLKQITESPAFTDDQKNIVEKEIEARRVKGEVRAEVTKASAPNTDQQVEDAIREAYANARKSDKVFESVSMSEVRKHIPPRFSREEVDAAVTRMNHTPQLTAFPESNQREELNDEKRAAGVQIGNQVMHNIAMPNGPKRKTPVAPPALTPEPTPAPVKAVAKKAAPTSKGGVEQFTEAELQDMNLGQLKDIEDERGIKRVSVAKGDRVQAILDHQAAAPAPAKKVTAAASKKAVAAEVAKPPSKATPEKVPSGKIEAGKYSDKPPLKNNWGGGSGEIHFHDDGLIGSVIKDIGQERRLAVGDDSLENVLGRIATDTVTGATTQQQMIDKLRALHSRLPDGVAKRSLGVAIDDMDTPKRTVGIPEGTPAPLRDLAKKLEGVPLARTDRTGVEGSSELTRLEGILQDFREGKVGGKGLVRAIQAMINGRHESVEGKLELDRILTAAYQELDAISKDKDRKSILIPKKKEE